MNEGLFGEEGAKTFFNHIMEMWIKPELKRRIEKGKPYTREIDRCLILLPLKKNPIVQFNEEGGFVSEVRKAPNTKFEYGDTIYVHQIKEVLRARPPKQGDKRIAFVFLILVNKEWRIFFDFSPSWPDYVPPDDDKTWSMGKDIADAFNIRLQENIIKGYSKQIEALKNIGLWTIPSLFPYPMSLILDKLAKGDEAGALSTLVSHCNTVFLESLSKKWFDVEPFLQRKTIIEDGLASHKAGKWAVSIHTLLPHMEGIINDWMKSGPLKNEGLPLKQADKMKKFSELANKKTGSFTYKHLAESSTNFILGPVLAKIDDWKKLYKPNVPNRHIVGHGDYDERYYSEESSIKVILLLDTIYYLIKNHALTA